MQMFWGETWGGFVTLKLITSHTIAQKVANLLQECTNELQNNGLLMEPVGVSASLVQRVGSQALLPSYSMPFLLIRLNVPKNYTKKLVGY